MVLLLVHFVHRILPESPRWLFAHGKLDKTERILRQMAHVNGRSLPPDYIKVLQVRFLFYFAFYPGFGTKNVGSEKMEWRFFGWFFNKKWWKLLKIGKIEKMWIISFHKCIILEKKGKSLKRDIWRANGWNDTAGFRNFFPGFFYRRRNYSFFLIF